MINLFKKQTIILNDTLNTILNLSEINIVYAQVIKNEDHNQFLLIRFTVKGSSEIKSTEISYERDYQACSDDQKKLFAFN